MHERVAVNAVRSDVNRIMLRISDGSVSSVRSCAYFHVGSLQPAVVAMTQTQRTSSSLAQGCRRAAFSKWKSADVRAGTTLFIPGAPLSIIPQPCTSAEHITTAVALLVGRPTDSFVVDLLGFSSPMGPDVGGPMPRGKSQPVCKYTGVRDGLVCISLRITLSSTRLQ